MGELASRIDGDPEMLFNLAGKLSLGGLFALLESARCVLTNDTGPMHMAWALGTPTVGLFGPVDPAHYGWRGAPNVQIIHKPIYCSPCVHEVDAPPCQGDNVCMKRITVEEVLTAIECVTRADAGSAPRPVLDASFFSDSGERPLGQVVRGRV
ncbi:MAG: glycosyltransferase family 9 protein [Isosphaeraceae bacterium]